MEIYEILYTMPAGEIESGDLIRFNWIDVDEQPYVETVHVGEVDYAGKYVMVTGFSEVLNVIDEFGIYEDTIVEVLGG